MAIRFLFLIIFLVLSNFAHAAAEIQGVRTWYAPDNTRIVFDLNADVQHNLFMLDNPHRVVIDIPETAFKANLETLSFDQGPIANIRYNQSTESLRLVLDLRRSVDSNSFTLLPNQQYGHRLVVDLKNKDSGLNVTSVAASSQPTANSSVTNRPLRDIIVAVDAGHGGEDPGALGSKGTREKDVVLAIARELKSLIDSQQGFKAVLIRDGDYFVSLRNRVLKARRANADLFVSIHADGWKSPSASGASVWVLSEKGASSEMGRWLAKRENDADLIGGVGNVSLEDKDEVLASVLLDMSMTASRTGSREVASSIHEHMKGLAKMHKTRVEMANFSVLRSPDVPSVLVETGFITNHREENLLRTRAYQRSMANAIYQGLLEYFWNKPPDLTWVAQRKAEGGGLALPRTHKVRPGDTLSVIAQRNGVSVAALRRENQLQNDKIRVGQLLKIPAG